MGRLMGYVLAFISIVVNYFIFYYLVCAISWVFPRLPLVTPEFIAFNLCLAMLVHEIGHVVAMEANGIPSFMIFLVFVGGASPLPDKAGKMEKLSWERRAVIYLAGVTGNLAIIFGALLLNHFGAISASACLHIVNLNGVLIVWNLVPLMKFDGYHFAKVLFDSIDENRDTKYEIGLIITFIVIAVVMLILTGRLDFINLALLLWGIHFQANHDYQNGSNHRKRIPERRQVWWAGYYLLLVGTGLIIMSVTPTWFMK